MVLFPLGLTDHPGTSPNSKRLHPFNMCRSDFSASSIIESSIYRCMVRLHNSRIGHTLSHMMSVDYEMCTLRTVSNFPLPPIAPQPPSHPSTHTSARRSPPASTTTPAFPPPHDLARYKHRSTLAQPLLPPHTSPRSLIPVTPSCPPPRRPAQSTSCYAWASAQSPPLPPLR